MTACPRCGTPAEPGALFCRRCGATVPQSELPSAGSAAGVTANSGVPPGATGAVAPSPYYAPTPAPSAAVPPPEWIPDSLKGRAGHCPRCNTLISAVAVVCPVCLAPLPLPGREGAVDARGR